MNQGIRLFIPVFNVFLPSPTGDPSGTLSR